MQTSSFTYRHVGPDDLRQKEILSVLNLPHLNSLTQFAVPESIRLLRDLALPSALSEAEALAKLGAIAKKNQVFRSFIGRGYHACHVPPVIQRNILENPGWYTQYTPYQSEISQGRLEGLLNFQTMVCELTALDIANASLLDEATACAEGMSLCHRIKESDGTRRDAFWIDRKCHPQNIEVVKNRAEALGIRVVLGDKDHSNFGTEFFGALIQYPATDGSIPNYRTFIDEAHGHGIMVVMACDLLALTLVTPPGELGADVAVGSAQRFGVPLGFGGPHAGYFATRDAFKRAMPGRLVGVSKDARGKVALRLSLGTREQHIRREKATSNICTAQALLANMAMAYACYHGPVGLRRIATGINFVAGLIVAGARKLGLPVVNSCFFDTLTLEVADANEIHAIAQDRRINLCPVGKNHVSIACDETTRSSDVQELLEVLNGGRSLPFLIESLVAPEGIPEELQRTSSYLNHPVFNRYHSETEMLRYLRRLESKDLSLCHSMIPLGSCTMKLNSSAEMFPLGWIEFSQIHPFAPLPQTQGYQELFRDLESWLAEITGFAAISLQPNSGSQGEYAGLLVIQAWHRKQGEGHRRICLIPSSAHGTNPASATMAGLSVVPVACDSDGNIDPSDLQAKIDRYRQELSCLMITYPSTHGVFESGIKAICQRIHEAGGQVYMDGANMNAQVGLTSPGFIGADVCHLNLHKTFCIPHGGGGPGVGPIGVALHLVPFLPGHSVVGMGGKESIGAVCAAPWGSASICTISWMYIAMMGAGGLKLATQIAILNANYISKRLENHFPTLFRGENGFVAHECILDLRPFKSVTAEDVAKRLMDYGFHAPTLSWPVAGTLMVEPTESESKAELDRFCDAMISIHGEILEIEQGKVDSKDNLLKNAPHTADQLCADQWNHSYSRERAGYPVPGLRDWKFWPAVARVDNVFGDRNLVCSCVGLEAYSEESQISN